MHTVALTQDGQIWSWGVNDEGALGRETGAAAERGAARAGRGRRRCSVGYASTLPGGRAGCSPHPCAACVLVSRALPLHPSDPLCRPAARSRGAVGEVGAGQRAGGRRLHARPRGLAQGGGPRGAAVHGCAALPLLPLLPLWGRPLAMGLGEGEPHIRGACRAAGCTRGPAVQASSPRPLPPALAPARPAARRRQPHLRADGGGRGLGLGHVPRRQRSHGLWPAHPHPGARAGRRGPPASPAALGQLTPRGRCAAPAEDVQAC